jgi:hypothetical protein
MNRFLLILFAFSMVWLLSCGSSTPTTKTNQVTVSKPCNTAMMKDLQIRWGGHNFKTNNLAGWQINGESKLFAFAKDGKDSEYILKEISKLDSEKVCELFMTTQKYFLEIQALNIQADSSNFVEFINNANGTNLRAAWNVRFKTHGSAEFRQLYDTLESIADREFKIFLRKGDVPGNSIK